ncbi:MAG: hypothetical protein ACTSRG_04305 [Candidatus Helarchaeota archaeon]
MDDLNFVKRGTPGELMKMKMGGILITMVYPGVISFFEKGYGVKGAMQYLRIIGANIAKDLIKYWIVKENKLEKILKSIFYFLWDSKVSVKREGENYYRIVDKNCGLCMDYELTFDSKEHVQYCSPIGGFLEAYLNDLTQLKEGLDYKKVEVSTIFSRGSGSQYCEHRLRMIEE